jgi:transcriptional regulator with XRE-family HTH domain
MQALEPLRRACVGRQAKVRQKTNTPNPLDPDYPRRLLIALSVASTREIAEATGVGIETVRRYLRGQREPNAVFVGLLCRKCGICAEWLVNGRGPQYSAQWTEYFVRQATLEELLEAVQNRSRERIADALLNVSQRPGEAPLKGGPQPTSVPAGHGRPAVTAGCVVLRIFVLRCLGEACSEALVQHATGADSVFWARGQPGCA